MILYPPFHIRYANGVIDNLGYHWLFDPPYESGLTGVVHIPTLFVQLVGLAILGSVLWVTSGFFSTRQQENQHTQEASVAPTLGDKELNFDPNQTNQVAPPAKLPRKNGIVRLVKRVGVTFIAFLASGIFILLWREYVPANSLTGAIMGAGTVAIVGAAWWWSDSFK